MKIKTRKRVSFIVPVTAMSDIAFLLLIFFMVTATLQFNPSKTIQIPEASNPKINMNRSKSEIFISRDGTIIADKEKLSLNDLQLYYIKKLINTPDLLVFLNGDRKLDFRKVNAVMDNIRQAGVKKLIFVTKRSVKSGKWNNEEQSAEF